MPIQECMKKHTDKELYFWGLWLKEQNEKHSNAIKNQMSNMYQNKGQNIRSVSHHKIGTKKHSDQQKQFLMRALGNRAKVTNTNE